MTWFQLFPRRLWAVLLGVAMLFIAFYSLAWAGIRDGPPPVPGFTHTNVLPDDSPQKHGIRVSGTDFVRGSPTIAEVDGNTGNGREVAIVGSDGILYIYRSNGQLAWQTSVMKRPNCTMDVGRWKASASPAVGAIYGDGVPHVVVAYGPIGVEAGNNNPCDGGIAAFRGTDGALRWRYDLEAVSPQEDLRAAITSPALADTDGDGKMEIAVGGLDRIFHLLNHDGTPRWMYQAADTIWASATFANVDSDPALEVIFGTDMTANPLLQPPTQDGGFMYAFDTQPRNPTLIPFRTGFIWSRHFEQTIYSSPIIADVLSSNPGSEIIVGSGLSFPLDSEEKIGQWVKILRLSDGAVLQTLNARGPVPSGVAVGDINDDGRLEIVGVTRGVPSHGNRSYIHAWNPNNPTPLWSTTVTGANDPNHDRMSDVQQAPVIADLDGNGSLEVLVSNLWTVHVLNGRNGQPLTCQNNATCGRQLALFAWKTLKATPAIGDVNGDGKLDVFIGGGHALDSAARGYLYGWTDFAGRLGSPAGNQEPYSAPWPMFRGDAHNTGVFGGLQRNPRLGGSSATVYHQSGSSGSGNSASTRISLRNTGDGVLNWTVASLPQGVSVTPRTGSIAGGGFVNLTVTVNTGGRRNGSYSLGNIVINGTDAATGASIGSATIPVRLVVGNIRRIHLPVIRR